jgi:nitrite reductase (NADH) small subunit
VKAHRVARLADLPEQGPYLVSVNTIEIGLFRIGSSVVAWRNVCPHQAAPVCRGRVTGTRLPSAVYEYRYGREGEILQCPWHGWEFDLVTGQHLAAGSDARLQRFETEIRGEDVYVLTRR